MIKPIAIFKIVMALILSAAASHNAKLNVNVKNIEVGKGTVVVKLYDSKENFLHKKWLVSKTLQATGENLQFTFEIPEGSYAVKVFQDINENGKCDEGWFHIPKEPYRLSNNFLPKFAAPNFEDCKFVVTMMTNQTIILQK